jgi:glycosyltransferase involved in cell wall biosynthesis
MMEKIKLSVLMLAYNHEPYIKQSIESVMVQKTNFNFELVIGEDNSTDNTLEIIKKLKRKYPNKIKLLLNKKNLGCPKNLINVAKNCVGKYIAFLEGDDFWDYDNKLQEMVNFLEAHEEYVTAYHDVNIIDEKGNPLKNPSFRVYKGKLKGPEGHIKYNGIPSLSLVFKNFWEKESLTFSKMLKDIQIICDYPLKLFLLSKGKIKYFDKKWGTYRCINTSGASFSAEHKKDSTFAIYDKMHGFKNLSELNTKFSKLFQRHYLKEKSKILLMFLRSRQFKKIGIFYKNHINNYRINERAVIFIYVFLCPFQKIIKDLERNLFVLEKKKNEK